MCNRDLVTKCKSFCKKLVNSFKGSPLLYYQHYVDFPVFRSKFAFTLSLEYKSLYVFVFVINIKVEKTKRLLKEWMCTAGIM